jgi:CBS domain-containing protein
MMRVNVDAAKMADRPISEVMTVNPATLRSRDKISFAIHRMNVGGFRHVPILDADDRLVGVISIRDILRFLTDHRVARG